MESIWYMQHEQDIEDLKQSMAQCVNNISPYDDYDWLGPRREFIFKPWFLVGFYKYRKFRAISLFTWENKL